MLVSGFWGSILKGQAASADADNHVNKHPHERLQACFIDGFSHDVESDRLIAMHQIADPEIGSRYVVCDNRVAINCQIGEGSRKHAAGFLFRPVELVPCSARNQWVRQQGCSLSRLRIEQELPSTEA